MDKPRPNYHISKNPARTCASCAYCHAIYGLYDTQRRNLCYRFSPAYLCSPVKVCACWEPREIAEEA